ALQGLSFGDPSDGSIVVWSRADRPSRMLVEWSTDEGFRGAQRIRGPYALDVTDFTARQSIDGLEAGGDGVRRASFQRRANDRAIGEPVTGRFVVPPDAVRRRGDQDDDDRDGRGREDRGFGQARDIRFLWAGDTAGQGWGINPDFGGMKIYESM